MWIWTIWICQRENSFTLSKFIQTHTHPHTPYILSIIFFSSNINSFSNCSSRRPYSKAGKCNLLPFYKEVNFVSASLWIKIRRSRGTRFQFFQLRKLLDLLLFLSVLSLLSKLHSKLLVSNLYSVYSTLSSLWPSQEDRNISTNL